MIKKTDNLRKALLESIMEMDDDHYTAQNIIYAKNMFLINSILSWYFEKHPHNEINISQISSFLSLLEKHVQGEVKLGWGEDGTIEIRSLKQKDSRKTKEL